MSRRKPNLIDLIKAAASEGDDQESFAGYVGKNTTPKSGCISAIIALIVTVVTTGFFIPSGGFINDLVSTVLSTIIFAILFPILTRLISRIV